MFRPSTWTTATHSSNRFVPGKHHLLDAPSIHCQSVKPLGFGFTHTRFEIFYTKSLLAFLSSIILHFHDYKNSVYPQYTAISRRIFPPRIAVHKGKFPAQRYPHVHVHSFIVAQRPRAAIVVGRSGKRGDLKGSSDARFPELQSSQKMSGLDERCYETRLSDLAEFRQASLSSFYYVSSNPTCIQLPTCLKLSERYLLSVEMCRGQNLSLPSINCRTETYNRYLICKQPLKFSSSSFKGCTI